LLKHGFGPITTLKAMRAVTGIDLRELKAVMDRAVPPEERDQNDRFRALAEAILMDDVDPQD
jgi:hypothetical protein